VTEYPIRPDIFLNFFVAGAGDEDIAVFSVPSNTHRSCWTVPFYVVVLGK
jgi:hypothetical protein